MDDVHNSSAYSSLANSNCDVNNSGGDSSPTGAVEKRKMSGEEEISTSEEIHNIISDYNATLKKATAQIKSLTKERHDLEVEYEKLMTMNETLAADLSKTLREKKRLEEEHQCVLEANEELFEEAQRLNDEESLWIEERENTEAELKELRGQVEELRRNEIEREAGEVLADKFHRQVETLQSEKATLLAGLTKLEIENKKAQKDLKKVEKERDNILSRKEMVTGENMQLIVEAENFHSTKNDLCNQLRSIQSRCKDLQKENAQLKLDRDTQKVDQTAGRYASLVEKNKNLTEWREQLIEKNKMLTDENKKIQQRCADLEELLNEEETDINDVLELIRTMQVASKKTATTDPGPISNMSALTAKLRDYK